jgi:hypothetical protein
MDSLLINTQVIVTWILFLALFPLAFIWLKRAYKIFIKKDYTEVALKRGEPPENPKRWAPFTGVLNLAAGLSCLWAILGVAVFAYPYQKWTGIAGVTIWFKIFGDIIIKYQAHSIFSNKKKESKKGNG